MDAWATILHYLSYKSSVDVPRDLRRDFYALSGLFYVADSHFEMFFKGRREKLKEISSELKVGNLDKEINLDTLSEFLSSKLPDRKRSEASGLSDFVSELIGAGYKNLKDLDAIERTWKAFSSYEKKYPPAGTPDNRFVDTSVVRLSLGIYDKNYRNSVYTDDDSLGEFEGMVAR